MYGCIVLVVQQPWPRAGASRAEHILDSLQSKSLFAIQSVQVATRIKLFIPYGGGASFPNLSSPLRSIYDIVLGYLTLLHVFRHHVPPPGLRVAS
ncbi:hypothetical protein B5X24_HaOG207257 [Helicoverpa armigera]|nr:hypothetical protein B5X24_HaOG207257 [Helicoverpa armigera]